MALEQPRLQQVLEILLNGADTAQVAHLRGVSHVTAGELVSRALSQMRQELELTTAQCVALCYVSREVNDVAIEANIEQASTSFLTQHEDALAEFLVHKDAELVRIRETLKAMSSSDPRAKEKAAKA